MRKMKFFGLALGLLAIVAVAQPAHAICGAPFLISTAVDVDTYSYVINPAVDPATQGLNGSTVTDQIQGFFWGVGVGNPTLGVGADNGSWTALDWLYIFPGYPAAIITTWAESTGIDTCIDVQGAFGSRCQATFVQDVDPDTGEGMFALLATADDDASGDFFLVQDGNAPIVFAPQPKMAVTGSVRNGAQGVTVALAGPTVEAIAAGSFLDEDPACLAASGGGPAPLNGLVTGYSVRYVIQPRGSQPPSNFAVEQWTDSGNGILPLGSTTQAAVDCGGQDNDVYLSYQLHFDSGFAAPFVSASTTRTECGPNVADPQERIRVAPETRQKPATRQQR
jgi:hypothetical protein